MKLASPSEYDRLHNKLLLFWLPTSLGISYTSLHSTLFAGSVCPSPQKKHFGAPRTLVTPLILMTVSDNYV